MAIGNSRAVFLDRDGVIIHDEDFIVDMEFTSREIEALKNIPLDYKKIVISNQSGVERGLFTSSQVDDFNRVLLAR